MRAGGRRLLQQLRASEPARVELLLVVRRGARDRARPRTPPSRSTRPRRPTRSSDEVERRRSTRCRPTSGVLVVHAGPERRLAVRPRPRTVTTAGRHPDSDIFLDDVTVSRRHAEIVRRRRRLPWSATSARSTAPTSTGSASTRPPLANGDELQIGKFKLVFFVGARSRVSREPTAPTCRSARSSACCRTSSPTSRSRRSASSRARACSTPSARRRATASSTRPTSSGCGGSCASRRRTSCRSRSSRTASPSGELDDPPAGRRPRRGRRDGAGSTRRARAHRRPRGRRRRGRRVGRRRPRPRRPDPRAGRRRRGRAPAPSARPPGRAAPAPSGAGRVGGAEPVGAAGRAPMRRRCSTPAPPGVEPHPRRGARAPPGSAPATWPTSSGSAWSSATRSATPATTTTTR